MCHRGISDYYPENTLGSIIETINCPEYLGVEIDIMITKDEQWIIYHDSTLLRLNSINKKVEEVDYCDINKIRWKGNNFIVNRLSDLEELVDCNFTVNIEIKPDFNTISIAAKENLRNIISCFKFKKFISSFDHNWYEWCIKYTSVQFACLTDKELPSKGNFWILDYRLLDNINVLNLKQDILEKNIELGCYGKKINDTTHNPDLVNLITYQIVDHKEQKIIYVDGTFDLLHPGHIDFFKKAKSHGNYLIVGVLHDSCVESYKRVPILTLEERTIMLENIKIVDKVISPAPFYESKFGDLSKDFIQNHNIDHVVYAGEMGSWSSHYQAAIDMDIMITFPYGKNNVSTSGILKRINI
jgi:cytidyltransferase-like protein